MLISMTGYGKTVVELTNYNIDVEVKSVNHKYCVVRPKLPFNLQSFEHRIISLIKSRFTRGSFDIFITIDQNQGTDPHFRVDISRINQLIDDLEKVRNKFHISDGISFESLALFKDFYLEKVEENYDMDKLWEGISLGVSKACDGLCEMRKKEGENLEKDILFRLEKLKEIVHQIEKEAQDLTLKTRTQLEEKIQSLLGDNLPDPERINQEIVFLVEKSDITEEITRLQSHIGQCLAIIKNEESPGRKLEFLMQELLREANTISGKVSNAGIALMVVDIKVEIDKIREQLLNVE